MLVSGNELVPLRMDQYIKNKQTSPSAISDFRTQHVICLCYVPTMLRVTTRAVQKHVSKSHVFRTELNELFFFSSNFLSTRYLLQQLKQTNMLGKEGPAGRLSLGASEAVMPRIPSERRDCEGGTRSLKQKSPKLLMETRIKLPQDFLLAPMECSSCCLVVEGVARIYPSSILSYRSKVQVFRVPSSRPSIHLHVANQLCDEDELLTSCMTRTSC